MELKLGSKTIRLDRVWKVTQTGPTTARICFVTGDAIKVRCNVKYPSVCAIAYPGTVAELIAVIDDYTQGLV